MNEFLEQLNRHNKIFVLTGAGISLPSGIPTYRDAKGQWTGSNPIQHGDFVADAATRQRYWARSMVGWRNFGKALPNDAHRALATAENAGRLELLVTQNVDRLHQSAGSSHVVDLHGRLDLVLCLDCGNTSPRSDMQVRLEAANPDFQMQASQLRPDGDADVPDELIAEVRVPACEVCQGVLKPDVVFFGDNVPKERVLQCQIALTESDAMLVVGSSLQVYSGFRFCQQAAEQSTPIYCINPGLTRADALISYKSDQPAELLLMQWATML